LSQFRNRLDRERDQADLDGRPCVLLVFAADGLLRSRDCGRTLIALVGRRFRADDAMSWISKQHLGVISRHIDPPKAHPIAEEVSDELMNAKRTRVEHRVYSYPANWLYHQPLDADARPIVPQSEVSPPTPSSRPLPGAPQPVPPTSFHQEAAPPDARQASFSCVGQRLFRPLPNWKRAVDIPGACAALLFFAPLMLGVAVWIRLTSSGPIIFRQVRWGSLGRPFTMLKFRTMRTDVDPAKHLRYVTELLHARGTLNKLDAQSELIPLGGLLRRSGLDELPQLFNVLRGEMSLVGPRPDVIPVDAYSPQDARRLEVAPGITGLWQVSGKNETTVEEMLDLDATYARDRSFWLDLKILLKTPPTLVGQVCDKKFSSGDGL
jgi:lipopolysaccharide/colanic/teichoic acid biosynthesis glycosyltransferase